MTGSLVRVSLIAGFPSTIFVSVTSMRKVYFIGADAQTERGVRDRRFQAILASLVLSHFCGLACGMFRLGRTAGSRFGRKHQDCRICYGFGFEGCRFGVSWCGITNKVLDTHVVFQEPRLTAVFAEASECHIHDFFGTTPFSSEALGVPNP